MTIKLSPEIDKIVSRKEEWPRGHMLEIYGQDGCGKSTLATLLIASAQKEGLKCGYIDAEYSHVPEHFTFLGVDMDNLNIHYPESGEDGLNTCIRWCGEGYGLVVVDSVAGLIPEAQVEMEEIEMGGQFAQIASLLAKGLPKVREAAHRGNTCIIFLNQIRAKIQKFGMGPEYDSAGGYAIKHFVSARFELTRVSWIKYANKVIGFKLRLRAPRKNRFAPPNRDVLFDVICDEDVDMTKINDKKKTKIEFIQPIRGGTDGS